MNFVGINQIINAKLRAFPVIGNDFRCFGV